METVIEGLEAAVYEAQMAFRRRDYEKVIHSCQIGLQRDPLQPRLLELLTKALYSLRDFEGAINAGLRFLSNRKHLSIQRLLVLAAAKVGRQELVREQAPSLLEECSDPQVAGALAGSLYPLKEWKEVDHLVECYSTKEAVADFDQWLRKAILQEARRSIAEGEIDQARNHLGRLAEWLPGVPPPIQEWRRLPGGWEEIARYAPEVIAEGEETAQRLVKLLESSPAPREWNPTSPFKLLLVSHGLGPGGSERQIVNTLKSLAASRQIAELHFLSPKSLKGDHYYPELRNLPIQFHTLEEAHSAEGNYELPEHLAKEIVGSLSCLQKVKPDVVHIWQDLTNIAMGVASLLAGVPRIVMSGRNMPPNHPYRSHHYQPYFRGAYRTLLARDNVTLTCNSHLCAESYRDWLGRELPTVIPNGIETPPINRRKGAPMVGGVFRFVVQKQPFLWLEVAERLAERHPLLQFCIVGDGPLKTKFERLVQEAALSSRFLLPGAQANLASWYSRFDHLLITSAVEGLPNVAIEALGHGVPVVSTACGGISEVVDKGVTGRVIASENPQHLANALSEQLTNESWRQRAAAIAPQQMRQRFSCQKMMERTLQVYKGTSR